jgi:hypothetical protein
MSKVCIHGCIHGCIPDKAKTKLKDNKSVKAKGSITI